MRFSGFHLVNAPIAAAMVAGLILAGCSDDRSTSSATRGTETGTSGLPSLPPTSPPSPGDTALDPGAEVLRFEVSGDVACVPETASVEVSYSTRDLDAVGFVVDGQGLQTDVLPPTSGTFTVPVPCDGKVHTIMLIGRGAGGPAFATKAIVTRPA